MSVNKPSICSDTNHEEKKPKWWEWIVFYLFVVGWIYLTAYGLVFIQG